MKIPVIKPAVGNLDSLREQLITLQGNMNQALEQVGYGQARLLSLQFRPTDFPKTLPTGLTAPAIGLSLIYLRNLTSDTSYPTNPPFINWIPEGGGVTIRAVTGLTSTSLYEARFLIYGR